MLPLSKFHSLLHQIFINQIFITKLIILFYSDAYLSGYLIPKDTHVLPNLYAIHMDPKLWDDPDKFDPSRFLKNGKVTRPDYFIPFSVGKLH